MTHYVLVLTVGCRALEEQTHRQQDESEGQDPHRGHFGLFGGRVDWSGCNYTSWRMFWYLSVSDRLAVGFGSVLMTCLYMYLCTRVYCVCDCVVVVLSHLRPSSENLCCSSNIFLRNSLTDVCTHTHTLIRRVWKKMHRVGVDVICFARSWETYLDSKWFFSIFWLIFFSNLKKTHKGWNYSQLHGK